MFIFEVFFKFYWKVGTDWKRRLRPLVPFFNIFYDLMEHFKLNSIRLRGIRFGNLIRSNRRVLIADLGC